MSRLLVKEWPWNWNIYLHVVEDSESVVAVVIGSGVVTALGVAGIVGVESSVITVVEG